jgi:hypothetical protein
MMTNEEALYITTAPGRENGNPIAQCIGHHAHLQLAAGAQSAYPADLASL